MKPTHTPGPWTFIESDDARIPDRIIGANGAPVVSGSIVGRDDAALIAAAPELLEALRLAYVYLNGGPGFTPEARLAAYDAARAAIAKATQSQES